MEEYLELQDHRAMIYLPENSVEVTITAKVFHDGEIVNVSNKYDMGQIREAFRKADEGYIDEEDTFVVTDKGRAYLEELENRNRGSVMFGSEN